MTAHYETELKYGFIGKNESELFKVKLGGKLIAVHQQVNHFLVYFIVKFYILLLILYLITFK